MSEFGIPEKRVWTVENWLGVALLGLIFLIAFGVGFGLGRIGREVEIQIKEKEVRVPFLDLTLSKAEKLQRLNAYANTEDLEVSERGTGHRIWQVGYKEGYRNARAR